MKKETGAFRRWDYSRTGKHFTYDFGEGGVLVRGEMVANLLDKFMVVPPMRARRGVRQCRSTRH